MQGSVTGGVVLTPYGLDIIESCLSCKMRAEHILCDLPPDALQSFESIKYATAYPKGAVLFVEGQSPRGIFVLCKGRVRLSICSTEGKTLILQVSDPGEVLGLSAAVSGKPYELTAETTVPCQVNFVKREDFLRFLKEHSDLLPGRRAAERQIQFGLPPDSRPRAISLRFGEAGQTAAGMERQKRQSHQSRVAPEAGFHPRGDRADDQHVAGNRDATVCRSQTATDFAGERLYTADPQQRGVESVGHHPITGIANRIQGCLHSDLPEAGLGLTACRQITDPQ